MKKILLASLMALFSFGIANAQDKPATATEAQAEQNGPKIEFTSTTHDYGEIKKAATATASSHSPTWATNP